MPESTKEKRITLAHGAGGKLSHDLVRELFWPAVPRTRWRAISKRMTAAATAALRDSLPACMGMWTRLGDRARAESCGPRASPPITSAQGGRQSTRS